MYLKKQRPVLRTPYTISSLIKSTKQSGFLKDLCVRIVDIFSSPHKSKVIPNSNVYCFRVPSITRKYTSIIAMTVKKESLILGLPSSARMACIYALLAARAAPTIISSSWLTNTEFSVKRSLYSSRVILATDIGTGIGSPATSAENKS